MTVRILVGDVRDRLAELPDRSVQCCVTSPPYFGLRDYGTAQWDGGDPKCDHQGPPKASTRSGLKNDGRPLERVGQNEYERGATVPYRHQCGKCGAVRIDQQLGLEPTLGGYIETLVQVFREVRRVLRDDGTLWLNLGDSYASSGGNGAQGATGQRATRTFTADGSLKRPTPEAKPKDLMMVPARVALALVDDGWYLRSDIIWHKPNPMPESVTDRPTSAHEHIFLLTKRGRYFYDADAIRDCVNPESVARSWRNSFTAQYAPPGQSDHHGTLRGGIDVTAGANARNVWTIATAPYKEAHFAAFPPEIPRRCILAGTSEKGACPACGAPWVRCVERMPMVTRPGPRAGLYGSKTTDGLTGTMLEPARSETTGWQPSCSCDAGDPVPCEILDPFAGAGTTLLVADQLGRDAVGIELNPEYARLIERRVRDDAPLFAEIETVPMLMQGALL